MRKVYILPNLFTAASLFCGMLAIMETFNGNYRNACILIWISSFLDVFDGAIARLTRSTSAFGLNFDSLSDLIAFGAAPAILAYSVLWESYPRLSAAVCSLFAICGALRLARFNVQATREESKGFIGLPIPAAALAIMSMIWLYITYPVIDGYAPLRVVLPPALVVIAYLMVSNVPFFGLKSVQIVGRQRFELLVTFVVITCLIYMMAHYLQIILFAMAWLYLLLGPVLAIHRERTLKAAELKTENPPSGEQPPHPSKRANQ